MLNPLRVLPLRLACQLLVSQNSTVPFIDRGKPSPKTTTELPSGYTVFSELGVAYKYYTTSNTWNAARKYCLTHGANLAVIDSYEKVQHVIRLKTASANVHVGMHRLFDVGEWVDVKDGSLVTAIPWRAWTFHNETFRQCMSLSTYGGDNGLFANPCDTPESFVCELSIFEDSIDSAYP